ncbi:MAG: GNAT family N-acetyltransferase [Deltaproteobacteria bacterium]|nr:GNAT family N-acetyltransferase [Deltaproteobacteria bacterium]
MLSMRMATATDAEQIHAFIVALATYEREPDAVLVTPERLRDQLASARPPFECILAEWSGVPAGFALFFQSYSTWRGKPGIWLEDLFVLPEHRGRGIGRALLERLGVLARDRDCARIEWSVLDWNELAIGFYRRLGALPQDAWTTYRLTGDALAALGRPEHDPADRASADRQDGSW